MGLFTALQSAGHKITPSTIGGIVGKHVTPHCFRPGLTHQLVKLILGFSKSFIPAAFGLDLVQNEAGNGFLLGFRQLSHGGKCFFE
jgi:hypothetical protein